MLDEIKEKVFKNNKEPENPLMKPFALGWTREVVNRIITKNRNLNCDIYYFSPSGKKMRSLTEIKANLTDGLTLDCFSFKRQPLGISENFETIRNARVKKKGTESFKDNIKPARGVKRAIDSTNEENKNENNIKAPKQLANFQNLRKQIDGKLTSKPGPENQNDEGRHNNNKRELRRLKSGNDTKDEKYFTNRKKSKTKIEKHSKRLEEAKRKKAFGKTRQANQNKVITGKIKLTKINRKKNTSSRQIENSQIIKQTDVKGKSLRNDKLNVFKNSKKATKLEASVNNQSDSRKETDNAEADKKSGLKDLRSIVKKNIGKYRELREKQKLAIKSKRGIIKKKITGRTRSEPISKNKEIFMKPLERGWRRELVFRTNCAKAGQQADVYYFHPSGKKLRSCREISENLTPGLTVDFFTFRKEPIGCGEPSEIIRQARFHTKVFQS